MSKKIYAIFILCLLTCNVYSQLFAEYFEDKTLRIDYIFSGNAHSLHIVLDEISQLPYWAGRQHNLSKLPLAGNGQVAVRDSKSGTIIYNHSFSTLFSEWLLTPESEITSRGFEYTLLIPFPKDSVEISVNLTNNYRETITSFTHQVDPKDLLIRTKGKENIPSYVYLQNSGPINEKINIAILPEGYTKEEMDIFYEDARITTESLFSHAPFDTLKHCFNVIAVNIPSVDSGVSIPAEGNWKETPFGSHFHTFYSERYLTTTRMKNIHNAIAGVPYEHLIILANTNHYGGGGVYNMFTLTTAHHPSFGVIVVHEFGHSFAGLGDEYFYEKDLFSSMYPFDVEPWEPNLTTLIDFESKWKDMLPPELPIPTDPTGKSIDEVGVYEGAGYSAKGIYRPAINCRMRSNNASAFCPVCQRAIERMIHFYTN